MTKSSKVPFSVSSAGAVAATRYVGGTTSGAPTTGTFVVGDFAVAQNGHLFICTVGGAPGTWVDAGTAGATAANVVTSTAATAAKLTDLATPPATPAVGDLWVDTTTVGAGAGTNSGWFGDGSDGAVVVSSAITLATDMYCTTLQVTAAGSIDTNGFRIHATTSVTIASGGLLFRDGFSATSAAGALSKSAGTMAATDSGGAGNLGAGTAGRATNICLGGNSGAGGAGTSAGGAAGSATLSPSIGAPRNAFQATTCRIFNSSGVFVGGVGAGGGGGDATNSGGGGGGGGGVIVITARNITNNGVIRASGGNGFSTTVGNTGGGGGGGGGAVIVNTNIAVLGTGTISAAGGTGGTGFGTGTAGGSGNAGSLYMNVWSS